MERCLAGRSDEYRSLIERYQGKVYNLLSDTGLSTEPAGWPVWDGHQDIEATPPENTLTIARPADPARFFVVAEFPVPPVTVLSQDFEGVTERDVRVASLTFRHEGDAVDLVVLRQRLRPLPDDAGVRVEVVAEVTMP